MLVETRQLGILLVILGIVLVGCSFRYRESIDEQMVRKRSLKHRLMMGYRVRITFWIFWTGLILMALGAALQW